MDYPSSSDKKLFPIVSGRGIKPPGALLPALGPTTPAISSWSISRPASLYPSLSLRCNWGGGTLLMLYHDTGGFIERVHPVIVHFTAFLYVLFIHIFRQEEGLPGRGWWAICCTTSSTSGVSTKGHIAGAQYRCRWTGIRRRSSADRHHWHPGMVRLSTLLATLKQPRRGSWLLIYRL